MGESTIGTVTVMFTDLVGSTQLRTRVGEDAAEVLRAAHDAILSDAIRANDGHVVKHLGDGLMATFASAASGVAAAVAIQQGIDVANRRTDTERLQVRVGLSVGDVTFEGDDCFGLPVVEAQRLEASAHPATIRCAELVMHLARGRGGHEFRPLGELELKGLPGPLAACEVAWEPLSIAAAPLEVGLPSVLAAVGLPFSGRDDTFQSLVDVWKECAVGGFAVVLLSGEPGVGKTRLARELAGRVQETGGEVLAGRCDEDVAVPFQAFGMALEWCVRHTPGDQLASKLGEFPGDLTRLVPHLADLVADLPEPLHDEPETERFRLFQAVESWLAAGGADEPRLLVLDDLHWADKPTLLLLRQLIAGHPPGLMILCTYRDTDVDRAHPLSAMLADFRRMERVTRVAVDGLGTDGVRELLTRTGGHELDDDGLRFAELVQRETSGNPFFLGEVLRHLAETGALYERDGRWVSDHRPEEAGIPEGIREVVGRRLSRLGDDVEQVLRAAAVIGYEFDVDLLADVVGRDVDEVLDALDTAGAASLVIEIGVDRHRFAHALVRETLHAELSSSRRARQHRKVAEAIEARHAGDIDAVITELATHWAEASAGGDPTRAIELAVRAGNLAVERGAYENGSRWFANALEMIDDADLPEDVRRRTLVKLAESQTASGSHVEGHVNSLLAARGSIAAGDADTACAALVISARTSFSDGDGADPERVAVLRDALSMTGLSVLQRAELLGELATELIMERDIAGRRAVLDEQRELLDQLSVADRGRLQSGPGQMTYANNDRAMMRSLIDTILEARAAQTVPSARRRLTTTLTYWSMMVGDRALMEQALAFVRSDRTGALTVPDVMGHMAETMCALVDGDLDRSAASADTLVGGMAALGLAEATVYQTTTTLALDRERGQLGELGWLADVTAEMGHPAGAARAISAYLWYRDGNIEPVVAALDAIDSEEFADDAGYPIVIAYWSEIVSVIGSDRQRRRFIDLVTVKSGTNIGTGGIYLGPADRLLALLYDSLGEHDRADVLFAGAVDQQVALASPPWIARTRLDWAESLIARDDLDRARVCVDAAAAAVGDLELPDARATIAEISARLAAAGG